jgi:hypothetical protein
MKNNIIPDQEILALSIDLFLKESKPYYDALSKIAILKPQKYLLNPKENTIIILPSDDTPTEINIKQAIEFIREKYLGEFEIKNNPHE